MVENQWGSDGGQARQGVTLATGGGPPQSAGCEPQAGAGERRGSLGPVRLGLAELPPRVQVVREVGVGCGRVRVFLAQHIAADGQRLLEQRLGPGVLSLRVQVDG